MTIYVICGPIGSKLRQFATTLAQTLDSTSDTIQLIDDAKFLEKTSESDIETFSLNAEKLLQKIQTSTSDDVIVYGHHFLSNSMLRNILSPGNLRRDVNKEEPDNELISKLFLDIDADTLLANYIREHVMLIELNVLLNNYTKFIKPQNEQEILPLMKFVDIVIPGYPKNDSIYELLSNSSKKNLLLTKNYKGDAAQTAECTVDTSRDKGFEDSTEESMEEKTR